MKSLPGNYAQRRASERTRPAAGGFSLVELLIVVSIILTLGAIAIPNLLRSLIAAHHAAAAENIRTITSAAMAYNSTYGNGFPPDLPTLGGPPGPASCNQSELLDQVLTTAPFQKSGYTYSYTGQLGNVAFSPPGCGQPGYNGYLVTAVPVVFNVTGTRSFCSDEPGVLHVDPAGNPIPSRAACEALPTL